MTLRSMLFGGAGIDGPKPNLAYALLRVYVGLTLAFNHGIGKLPPSERFVQRVEMMGFPFPDIFVVFAGLSEFAGGLLLSLGLLTRPSSFFILITMLVAGFIRHAADPFGGGKELALTYACCAALFIIIGSGKYGMDALLRKRS